MMTFSGDGVITGLAAGGLPDATIQTADLVDGAVTPVKLSGLILTQPNQTPLPGTAASMSWAHGLGVVPAEAWLELVCLTAELGYSVGDVVTNIITAANASYAQPFSVACNTTSVLARTGNVASFYLQNLTTGAQSTLTAANWAWRFKVRAA